MLKTDMLKFQNKSEIWKAESRNKKLKLKAESREWKFLFSIFYCPLFPCFLLSRFLLSAFALLIIATIFTNPGTGQWLTLPRPS
jgi:hypothetical protein